MTGRSSRRKGHDEERKVARELRALGFEAETTRSNHRARDAQGVDVEASAPRPLAVQVKRGARPNIRAALREAVGGACGSEVACAVVTFLDLGRPRRLLVFDWDAPEVRCLLRRGCGVTQAEQEGL